jgi:hypothetical protein
VLGVASVWLAPVKLPPFCPGVCQRKRIRPRKLGLRNSDTFRSASQVIVVKIMIPISASRVIPHAQLRLLALRLKSSELVARHNVRLSAATD